MTVERGEAETIECGVLAVTGIPWASGVLLAAGLAILGVVLVHAARTRGWAAVLGASRGKVPVPNADRSVEVEELVRQLTAELDDRAARLERLIAEADDRLARLGVVDQGSARRATPGHAAARRPEGRGGGEPLRVIEEDGDPVMRRIYSLADEGLAAVEIARQVGQPTGKVELILALRGR